MMTELQDESNEIPRYFRRQPRMRYHFSDDLRMAVIGGEDEALMRFGAHLQACPDCQARQFQMVEKLSSVATSASRPGSVAPVTTPSVQPSLGEADNPRLPVTDEGPGFDCSLTRSAYFRFLEQDRDLDEDALYHLMTCEDCRAHLTDAALTRYTIEMHGEEELPAIG
jgi:hypothetical protein